MRRTLLALALILAVSGAQAKDDNGRDIDKVNGGIRTESGQSYGDLSTVNGGIDIVSGTTVDEAETVNGGIDIGDDVKLGSASAVNGGIEAGQRLTVRKGLETVNGRIRVGFLSQIGGDISTVNGGITVQQTDVAGRLETVTGDITVGAKSHIHGGILVQKPQGMSWGNRKRQLPRIVIGPNAIVDGDLRFEHEVELFVHPTAKVGTITGATAQPYTDSLPNRPSR